MLHSEFCFDHETGIIAWGRIHSPVPQPFSYQWIFHVFYITACSFFSKRLWKVSVVNVIWIRSLVKKKRKTTTKQTNQTNKNIKFLSRSHYSMSDFSKVCFLHGFRQPYVIGSCCPGFDSSWNLRGCLRGDSKVIFLLTQTFWITFPLQEPFFLQTVYIQIS